MTRFLGGIFAVLALGALAVDAANSPHIQYGFPAGGCRGEVFEMEVGGQYLRGTTNVFVSGEGVRFEILDYGIRYEPARLRGMYNQLKNAREELKQKTDKGTLQAEDQRKLELLIDRVEGQLKLMDLPDGVDPLDRKAVSKFYKNNDKEQFNPQIADRLRLRVHVAESAPPGERELRVYTPSGLSNPIYFQVGVLPEIREREPNDDHMSPDLQLVSWPAIINGQIRPGDIDHFQFQATKGDSLVVDVAARRVIPYLADAVPGWFQAVVALYDAEGREVAYQDDYKFNPDPVLFFDVPETGTYTLSIRDSIYRGREDFIYRVAIGELPFITSIFPLGARQGKAVDIALSGRNLPKTRMTGTLPNNGLEVRHVSLRKQGYRSNQMPFAIDELPERVEVEPNDDVATAEAVRLPLIINGRVNRSGDRDVFAFKGKAGETVSIEVIARRLNSPLDSIITLSGPGLTEPVRNDDSNEKDPAHLHLGAGLVTHHADSYLLHELPGDGIYFVEIADAQNKGGHEHAYRLRISPAKPDFNLRMEPSGLHVGPGGTAAFTVRALRRDGFDKLIKLEAADLPDGFTMSEAVIPKGADSTRFTITAPKQIQGKLVSPRINGTGMVAGRPITRPAIPVDDQMQAFLYRHLVPAKELVLAPVSEPPPLAFQAKLPKSGVIELQVGRETKISLEGRMLRSGLPIVLDQPPEGFSTEKNGWIGRKKLKGKGSNGKPKFDKDLAWGSITVSVDESVRPGTRASLILQAEMKVAKEKRVFHAPAIPVKVVKARN